MGMYDHIVCRYPLPTTPPLFTNDNDHTYQTKSLDCRLATYEITEDGRVRRCSGRMRESEFDSQPLDFNGVIEFYSCNGSVVAYGLTFTPDGSDYESVTYEATFVDGAVQKIVETEREREPALAREVYHQLEGMFQEDRPVIDLSEPEIGAEMYVLWGSLKRKLDGYPAKLIAKTSRRWTFVGRHDKTETIDSSQLGNCLFHTEADAKAQRTWEWQLWDRKREYGEKMLQTKK